jgi:hypothetical protein
VLVTVTTVVLFDGGRKVAQLACLASLGLLQLAGALKGCFLSVVGLTCLKITCVFTLSTYQLQLLNRLNSPSRPSRPASQSPCS